MTYQLHTIDLTTGAATVTPFDGQTALTSHPCLVTLPLPIEGAEVDDEGNVTNLSVLGESLQGAIDEAFTAPQPQTVPDEITRRQFHLVAYSQFGLTEDAILAAIQAIPDEQQRTLALIDYSQAGAFKWDWPLLVAMADAMGITEEQRKAAWIAGAQIK